MGRGSADEAIVAIKLLACEGMVTYLRIKLTESGKKPRRRVEHGAKERKAK